MPAYIRRGDSDAEPTSSSAKPGRLPRILLHKNASETSCGTYDDRSIDDEPPESKRSAARAKGATARVGGSLVRFGYGRLTVIIRCEVGGECETDLPTV